MASTAASDRQIGQAPATGQPSAGGLFLLTAVILLQELALIRWLPGQVRVLAYFPNLVLIAAFLGLGLGCLRAGHRSLLWSWPAALLVVALAAIGAGNVAFTESGSAEHLWLLYYDLARDAPTFEGARLPVLAAFVLVLACFVAPGQLLAERLDAFARSGRPLHGYALDLGGSLAGVVLFAVLGWQQTAPIAWFALLLLGTAAFFRSTPLRLVGFVAAGLAIAAIVQVADRAHYYSPYYALQVNRSPDMWSGSPVVLANGSLHQVPIDVARDNPPRHAADERARTGFHIPFDVLERTPRSALVLGAGTGNDVAVLLDRRVEQIDAVEIDPVILRLGEELHPNRPYDSPSVRRINTDARSFLETTDRRYDLIVFGTLDSMTRLSALSNVRLDNFVYTVESLRAARALLNEGGGMVLYFMVSTPYLFEHLERMLTLATGAHPKFVRFHNGLFNVVFMAGPAFAHLGPETEKLDASALAALTADSNLPTDDWPFLYLPRRGVSGFYVSLIAAIGALALVLVFVASPSLRASVRRADGVDLEMFLYGFAFLLLETQFITTVNLLWGVTWLASAVVFAAILATMLAATLLAATRPLPWWLTACGVVAALLVAVLMPVSALLDTSMAVKLALSILFVGSPVFLAASCFAVRFRTRTDAGNAFGWNLLGAVFGGLAEFSSMAVGFKALLLIAAAAYLGAFLLRERERRAVGRSGETVLATVTSRT